MSTVFCRCSIAAKPGLQYLENSATILFQRHLNCHHINVSDIKEHTPTSMWYQTTHSPNLIPKCQPDTVSKCIISYNLPSLLAMETQHFKLRVVSFCFGGTFSNVVCQLMQSKGLNGGFPCITEVT